MAGVSAAIVQGVTIEPKDRLAGLPLRRTFLDGEVGKHNVLSQLANPQDPRNGPEVRRAGGPSIPVDLHPDALGTFPGASKLGQFILARPSGEHAHCALGPAADFE